MYVQLVCETHKKILLSDPETSLMTPCLLSLRHPDDHMETTYHPSCLDHLETFLNDWGDQNDHIWKPGFIYTYLPIINT